jgi:hypothetical protein
VILRPFLKLLFDVFLDNLSVFWPEENSFEEDGRSERKCLLYNVDTLESFTFFFVGFG